MFFVVFSCTTKKSILYVQDIDASETYLKDYYEYTIKVDDILKIDVNSHTPEASNIFNSSKTEMNNRESVLYYGYQVNSEGYINFPSLGKINVLDKTINEIRDYIYNTIKDNEFLIDPHVDVKLINAHFTILGEINNPGRYGDGNNLYLVVDHKTSKRWVIRLTINGKRRDMGLGSAFNFNIREARELATHYIKLAKQGIDPIQDRLKEKGLETTFKECV